MTLQRKLAAILSADVVGYSRLMERDEAGTLARLKANRLAIFQPLVEAHGGRTFKLMGDGALAEFASVHAAISCAHEIQTATARAEPELPEDQRICYRIGVNLGDVIVEGDDIYGEGVNVAARLQALASPGGVALSRNVRDQVAGKVSAGFDDLGEHTVKNIERPIHVFALRMRQQAIPAEATGKAASRNPRVSVCVLPFNNISGDPEQEYFSDGITEDIITDLSKVSALSVVSRNTSFAYKGKAADIAQVARQLKVSHVLEGSVRKSGNRVRITAQLIEGAGDSHVWAERYDRDLSDIFALQDEISAAIVAALKLHLLPSEKKAIETRSTTNAEAYKLYLMARQYHLGYNARHRVIAVRIYQRALEIDPNYARAWACLAICQAHIRGMDGGSGDGGGEAAEKALALESNLAEAHTAKACVLGNFGRHAEAWAEHECALRLDPNSYDVNLQAGRCGTMLKRYDEALRYLNQATKINESEFYAIVFTIQCYEGKGDPANAREAARRVMERVEKIIAVEPDNDRALSAGTLALARLGDRDRTLEWATRAMLLDPDNLNLRYNMSCAMVAMGAFDQALELLMPAFKSIPRALLEWFKQDNDVDAIRDDPRIKEMLAQAEARLAQEERTVTAPAGA
ncbi:MAG: TPR end-of-group domain-containing protein [Stenotrophobium sp.]